MISPGILPNRKTEVAQESAINKDVKSPKERLIIEAALEMLIETGDAGLTMRKLAERAEMRLSNVQYYFKTKDDVLRAVIARYFAECTENLNVVISSSEAKTTREKVEALARSGLAHGAETSDMCRAFREIWALSSRNDIIDRHLMEYYGNFSRMMADFVCGSGINEEQDARLRTLLMAFIEGYSITARSVPHQTDVAIAMLTDLAMSIIDERT